MSINNLRYTWPNPPVIDDIEDSPVIKAINITGGNLNIIYDGGSEPPKPTGNCTTTKGAPLPGTWKGVDTLPKGIKLIGYSCGGGTCGAYGLKGSSSDLNIINGIDELIVPWVTTLNPINNTCLTQNGAITDPSGMNKYLNSVKSCINQWGGEKYLSIGGWGEGYTFNQGLTKKGGGTLGGHYTPEIMGDDPNFPIKDVVACFNVTSELCISHPTNKLMSGDQNWGYWCGTKGLIQSENGKGQGAIPCDGGTVDQMPIDCWSGFKPTSFGDFVNPTTVAGKLTKYLIDNDYTGLDVDFEAGGDIGNQPFNGFYMCYYSWAVSNYSVFAPTNENQRNFNVVHAPLNNFFLDNKKWKCTKYDTFFRNDKGTNIPIIPDGDFPEANDTYYCEKGGGYGQLLFELHQQNVNLKNIFIQFYNNPPGPCDASDDAQDYCVTCGNIGSIGEKAGKYITIGPACSGGASFNSGTNQAETTKLLQCNYKEDKGSWAWQKAGYLYSGQDDQFPAMSGQYAGDPVGYYVKEDNPWLTISKEEDRNWSVSSYSDNKKSKPIQIGGIKNLILTMLLAKSYQPEATISLGTVPPGGGNSSNLSSQMVFDIYRHLINLQNSIDDQIKDNGVSESLLCLMNKLLDAGRLSMKDMDETYWTKYWGGVPKQRGGNGSGFCSRYPGYDSDDISKKLFGGLGAWSIYWTELTPGADGSNWFENIKKFFNANQIDTSTCKSTGTGYCAKPNDQAQCGTAAFPSPGTKCTSCSNDGDCAGSAPYTYCCGATPAGSNVCK